MKKLLTIFAIFILLGTISVSATSILIENKPVNSRNISASGKTVLIEKKSVTSRSISVSAKTVLIEKKPVTSGSGSFIGEIGNRGPGGWKKVGEISGTYQQKNKFYKFDGNWKITAGKLANTTGTMQGIFVKQILYGRIIISGSGKKAPIIGFIKFNETTLQFSGRFMSTTGPALYFQGTYQ